MLANFSIKEARPPRQFAGSQLLPYHCVIVRTLIDADAPPRACYLSALDEDRSPDLKGYRWLDVECLFPLKFKSPDEVCQLFQGFHVKLITEALTPEMLKCLVREKEEAVTGCVRSPTYWGTQSNGVDIAGNICHKDGVYLTHDEARVAIVPSIFTRSENLPQPVAEFPYVPVIPWPHVRYIVGMRWWSATVGELNVMHRNNAMNARMTAACGVAGLYADRLWRGEHGLGRGAFYTWIFSRAHGNTKSTAADMVHCLVGASNRSMRAGDFTKASSNECTATNSNKVQVFEDYVPSKDGGNKMLAQMLRANHDKNSRTVTGKVRTPQSTIMISANGLENMDDEAYHSRGIVIPFEPIVMGLEEEEDPNLGCVWQGLRELVGALQVDFCTYLWNGKLDREAIMDLARYFNYVVGKRRDRNCNHWAVATYFFLQLNYTFQASSDEQERVFEYLFKTISKSLFSGTTYRGVVERFILAVHAVRQQIPNPIVPGAMDKSFHWHNYRESERPPLTSGSYIAIRVQPALAIIKAALKIEFRFEEINAALEDCDYALRGKAKFYDASRNAMPIKKSVQDDESYMQVDVPLPEDELLASTLCEQRCVFFKTTHWKQIIDKADAAARCDVDYKNVIINSANPDQPPYNLYEAVCGLSDSGWFGYRCQAQCSFRYFNGALNLLNLGVSSELCVAPDMDRLHTEGAWGTEWHELFNPQTIATFFNGSADFDLEDFPPCYYKLPFTARDDPDDDPIPDPMDAQLEWWSPAQLERAAQGVGETRRVRRRGPCRASAPDCRSEGSSPSENGSPVRSHASPPPSRSPLSDVSNKGHAPRRKRRNNAFILGEAEDDDDDGEENDEPVSLFIYSYTYTPSDTGLPFDRTNLSAPAVAK